MSRAKSQIVQRKPDGHKTQLINEHDPLEGAHPNSDTDHDKADTGRNLIPFQSEVLLSPEFRKEKSQKRAIQRSFTLCENSKD